AHSSGSTSQRTSRRARISRLRFARSTVRPRPTMTEIRATECSRMSMQDLRELRRGALDKLGVPSGDLEHLCGVFAGEITFAQDEFLYFSGTGQWKRVEEDP